MKIAIPIWNKRISPVFDVAEKVLILDVQNRIVRSRSERTLEQRDPFEKVGQLRTDGVKVLVCGAISRPVTVYAEAQGIRTIPFVAGDIEDVIKAYLEGRLASPGFLMPGCYGRQRRFRGPGGGRGMGARFGGRRSIM